MRIVLEGLPERVQETADVLDLAFPGLMTWCGFATLGQEHAIRLEGKVVERSTERRRAGRLLCGTPASGQISTLTRARRRVLPQRDACCSLWMRGPQP